MSMSRTRAILLDGDITAYQFAVRAEKSYDWGDGLWTLHADAEIAAKEMSGYLHSLLEDLEADKLIIALSDRDNFRKGILPTYKNNRVAVRKPLILPVLRDHMREFFNVVERPGLEGDDILGILATSDKIVQQTDKVVVSIDKDLRSIPCRLLNLAKAAEAKRAGEIEAIVDGIVTVTEAEADRYHLLQTLTGDTTDGYSGCPGVGPVAANAILDDPHTLVEGKNKANKPVWKKGDPCSQWEAIVWQYRKAGLGEAEALRQSRVARILRNTDYNFKTKEPRLWTPNIPSI